MGSEGRSLSADVAAWNPFEDVQPFNQLTEDHIFGAEFDKIRRGSNTSISGVKSRESLVMTYTELPEDPFESAPFSLPSKLSLKFYISRETNTDVYIRTYFIIRLKYLLTYYFFLSREEE